MRVQYKSSIIDKIRAAIELAEDLGKEIDYIELTTEEFSACLRARGLHLFYPQGMIRNVEFEGVLLKEKLNETN